MYLMIADEADQDGAKEFLVFAGVFFPAEQLLKITNSVVNLRKKIGFSGTDMLKSSFGTKPKDVSPEDHAKIKNAVLKLGV